MEHTGTLAPIAAPPRLSVRRLGREPAGLAAATVLGSVLPIAVTALGVTVLALGLPQPADECELGARQAHAA